MKSMPKYLYQMKPPKDGVAIAAIENGTLIHVSHRHLEKCVKPLPQTVRAWVQSKLYCSFGTDCFYRDNPLLREFFCVPADAPELVPFQRRVTEVAWGCRDRNNPHFYLWQLGNCQRSDFERRMLPIGRFV